MHICITDCPVAILETVINHKPTVREEEKEEEQKQKNKVVEQEKHCTNTINKEYWQIEKLFII
jgi:hypothetical protein